MMSTVVYQRVPAGPLEKNLVWGPFNTKNEEIQCFLLTFRPWGPRAARGPLGLAQLPKNCVLYNKRLLRLDFRLVHIPKTEDKKIRKNK